MKMIQRTVIKIIPLFRFTIHQPYNELVIVDLNKDSGGKAHADFPLVHPRRFAVIPTPEVSESNLLKGCESFRRQFFVFSRYVVEQAFFSVEESAAIRSVIDLSKVACAIRQRVIRHELQ